MLSCIHATKVANIKILGGLNAYTYNLIYDPKNGMVLNVGALIDSLTKKDPAATIEDNPYTQAADIRTTVNTDISDITINKTTGDVIIHTTDSNTLAPVRSVPGDMVAIEGSTPAFRVERFVTSPLPHRPVLADFPHTVPLKLVLLN